MPAAQVLDSHALLALLRDEPGAGAVAAILQKAGQRDQPVHITEVNYADVQYTIRRNDGDAAWQTVSGELVAAPIQFHPADRRLADLAADFKARFKRLLRPLATISIITATRAEAVSLVTLVVMLPQEVFAKIAFQIAPDGMDMVRRILVWIGLSVVVLVQKSGALNAVVMSLPLLR